MAKRDLISSIDSYLSGRGSPMAGLGAAFVQAGRRHGVDPRLLVGIGVIESGGGKFEKNPNNFANWGVHRGVQYGSHEEAIDDLARGLRKGYISKGLKTPQSIVQKYAPPTENDSGNWARVVSSVMRTLGGPGAGRGVHPGSVGRGGMPTRPPPGPPPLPQMKVTGGINATALARSLLSGMPASRALELNTTPQEVSFAPPPGVPKPAATPGLAPITEVMPSDNIGAQAVKVAATQLGDPYVFGASSAGADPSSFDCSSLVQWSYRQLGIDIPRDTYGQQKVLRPKSWKDLKPGDPIYRRSGGHVVIYAGNGQVIAAPHTGTVVKYQPLKDFPQDSYVPYQIPRQK